MTRAPRFLPLLLPLAACLTGLLTFADADVSPDAHGGRFGFAVQGGIAANSSYNNDYAVGAPFDDIVYIYGDTDPTPIGTFAAGTGDETGWALTRGDVVGTFGADLVVASHSFNNGRGRVFILESTQMTGALGPSDAWVTLEGRDVDDYAGWDVALGDFDDDGHRDVLVGMCGRDDFRGAVAVAFGPFTQGSTIDLLDTTQTMVIRGEAQTGNFGCAVAAGDIDGNGRDEIIVGADRMDGGLPPNGDIVESGEVYAIFSKAVPGQYVVTNAALNMRSWTGEASGDSLGFSVASGDDYDGDEIDDLVIGASGNWCDWMNDHSFSRDCINPIQGKAYIILGKSRVRNRVQHVSGAIDAVADATLVGANAGEGYGWTVEMLGDMNGDDKSEVAIGSRIGERIDVAYGTTVSPGSVVEQSGIPLAIDGSAEGLFVQATSGADVNSDGLRDLIVGAGGTEWTEDGPPTVDGQVHVFFGE